MSLLYKRPNSPYWYVTKTRESTKTANRKLAEEYARKALVDHWRTEALGESRKTWQDLVDEWEDTKGEKKTADKDRLIATDMTVLLIRRKVEYLADVTADILQQYAKEVKARTTASTANRHINTLKAMMRYAYSREWITKVPKIDRYQVQKVEPKWLTKEQLETFVSHLPEWVRDMAIVGAQTGMRYGNLAGLQWSWITPDGSIAIVPAISTKTQQTYTVPLNNQVQAVLKRHKGKDETYVFVNPETGQTPVPSLRNWFDRARDITGINATPHTLRHTFASWHVQNGTPDRILQQMCGWASPAMLSNYAHLATEHLTAYADNLNKEK